MVEEQTKNWTCKRISLQGNSHIYGIAAFAFGIFVFFAVFLLAATYISVIGVEDIDLNARLVQYWHPDTDPFVWVLVSVLGLSILLWGIAAGIRKGCYVKK